MLERLESLASIDSNEEGETPLDKLSDAGDEEARSAKEDEKGDEDEGAHSHTQATGV